ncbi:unnamed protein product [Cladocopium goreaui]|uniref:EF-hand domain-containing protein n=1 Tax=Cladocopium goreaui TaxID=2562237 RepID=A0A9P1FJ98_9DINO|nr:unnamed protein product [Cladocopium goreaui]
MQVWQTVSSSRQRARNAERITKKLQEEVKQRAVKRAYDQIGAFEDHWRYLKEKTAREEAEEEAELVRLSEGWSRARAVQMERQLAATLAENSSETSSVKSATTNLIRNSRSESTLASRAYLDRSEVAVAEKYGEVERSWKKLEEVGLGYAGIPKVMHESGAETPNVLHAYRPPSPLHLYDYGGISVRPRSQQQQLRGATGRPAYRREFLGVYFPGPDAWPRRESVAKTVLTQHEDTKSKTPVRGNRAHAIILKTRKDAMRKRDQEAFIEQARFEQGQFEGRFANPLQKNSGWPNEEMINELRDIGAVLSLDAEKAPVRSAWEVRCPAGAHGARGGPGEGTFPGLTALAKHIFLSLHSAPGTASASSNLGSRFGQYQMLLQVMRKRRANLKHLFKYVNHGIPGILEPHEFLEGLQRLGIVERGQCSAQEMADLMNDLRKVMEISPIRKDLDPNFDGRVALSEVNRCVQATRAVCGRKVFKDHISPPEVTKKEIKEVYTGSLPVEKVTVERQPKSLWDFECSFEELRAQQHALLVLHKEGLSLDGGETER